jgi:hypothetical protein
MSSGRLECHCRRALDSLAEELLAAAAAVLTSGATLTVLGTQSAAVTMTFKLHHDQDRRQVIFTRNCPNQTLQKRSPALDCAKCVSICILP